MDFLCQECGQGFEIRWKLESHIKFQHDTNIFKCIKCGEEIIGKGKYDNHLKTHKTTTCKACWLMVPANSWSSHKLKCTGNLLSCEKCLYTTPLKGHLNRHNSQIHETVEPKIKDEILNSCVHFKKTFKMKKILDKHVKIHSSVKLLPCIICDNKFANQEYLTQHIQIIHQEKTKTIITKDGHKGLFNEEPVKETKKGLYKCESCDYST